MQITVTITAIKKEKRIMQVLNLVGYSKPFEVPVKVQFKNGNISSIYKDKGYYIVDGKKYHWTEFPLHEVKKVIFTVNTENDLHTLFLQVFNKYELKEFKKVSITPSV